MCLSKLFIQKIKLSHKPAYKLAWAAGLHPNTLSKYIHGALKPRLNNVKLIKIGEMLGLTKDEVFELEVEND